MLGPLANGIFTVLNMIVNMAWVLVFASVLVSWIGDPNNNIVSMIRGLTEPIYRPIRKLTGGINLPIDLAPLIVMLVLAFIQKGVLPYILMLGDSPQAG